MIFLRLAFAPRMKNKKGFSEKNGCFTVSRASFNDGMVYGDDVVEILVVSCFLFFSRSSNENIKGFLKNG